MTDWLPVSLMIVIAVVGLAPVVWAVLRHRPRFCPDCRKRMERLDEKADDKYLERPQYVEEQLGSVDYDVWLCRDCKAAIIVPYTNWKLRWLVPPCPECGYRTMKTKRIVVREPDEDKGGKAKLVRVCRYCRHREVEFRSFGHIQAPGGGAGPAGASGSAGVTRGGGGFGGGASGGGGATGGF